MPPPLTINSYWISFIWKHPLQVIIHFINNFISYQNRISMSKDKSHDCHITLVFNNNEFLCFFINRSSNSYSLQLLFVITFCAWLYKSWKLGLAHFTFTETWRHLWFIQVSHPYSSPLFVGHRKNWHVELQFYILSLDLIGNPIVKHIWEAGRGSKTDFLWVRQC